MEPDGLDRQAGLNNNSVSGLCDMGGSVWEWTSPLYNDNKGRHVVRGGSWFTDNTETFRASHRWVDPGGRDFYFGMRCARSSQ